MSEMRKFAITKWLPRHLLSFYLNLFFIKIETQLMSYAFTTHRYHYLAVSLYLFDKPIFIIDLGRDELLEKAHEIAKKMKNSDQNAYWKYYDNYPYDLQTGNAAKGRSISDSREFWEKTSREFWEKMIGKKAK